MSSETYPELPLLEASSKTQDAKMSSPRHALLSPSPSTISTQSSSTQQKLSKHLPLSRSRPLKPGSQKEISLINYIDAKILRITRRYAKKFSNSNTTTDIDDDAQGYISFDEVVADLDAVFDVVWISGTPSLQVPYLLTLAGLFASYMPAFEFSGDVSMFRLVRKLDEGFACLLNGEMGNGYHVTTTDRVRIKSLVEETRVITVDAATESGRRASLDYDDDSEDDEEASDDELPEQVSMSLSKIYRRTIELLGDSLV